MMKKIVLLTLLCFAGLSAIQAQNNTTYWQQHVDYTMEIDMNTTKHQLTGKQKLVYTNNSPDELDKVFYHLYFNAFQPGSMMDIRSRTIVDPDARVRDRIFHLNEDEIGYQHIKSLKQDGRPVQYEVDGTVLIVDLAKPIRPGTKTTFEMEFEAQVPLQIRRTGWNNAEGVEFSMSQWYPKMAEYDYQGWSTDPYIAREFHSPFGNFDVKITIDKNYVIGGTGILQNPQEIGYGYEKPGSKVNRPAGDKLTWHFKAENVLDFFFGADPDYIHTTKQVPNGPLLHFFYQKEVKEGASTEENARYRQAWEAAPDLVAKAFRYTMDRFGEYPYPQFSVVQGGDGGMEYPMGTLVTGARPLGSLIGVIVHEFYHSWFQNVLATNEYLYPWMDEGFTSFGSAETMAYTFNEETDNPYLGSYRGYFNIVRSGLEEPLSTHSDHYNTNAAYSAAAYSKGAVYLAQLRYVIGEETFRRGMLRYFDEWKLKHPTPNDFRRIMEKESGLNLDWYNQYFVNSTKTIDYGIKNVIGSSHKTVVQLERVGLMPMPLDVVVEYTNGSSELFYIPLRIMRGNKPAENQMKRTILDDWVWVAPEYTFEIPVPAENIKTITIDPSQRMADINRKNNSVPVSEMLGK